MRKETDGERVFKQIALGCLVASAQDEKNIEVRPDPQANTRRHDEDGDFAQEEQDRKVKRHRQLEIQHGPPMPIRAGRLILADDPDDEWGQHIRCRNPGNQDQRREMAGSFPCVVLLLHGGGVPVQPAQGKPNRGHCNIDFS